MKQGFVAVVMALAMLLTPLAYAAKDKYEDIEIVVNINKANAEELDKLLVGIGPDKAENIIQYRKQNGKFATADDLAKVKGIGPSTVEKNRDRIEL
ncbi:helix-hairpin-helix domain-containing protein [Photobacterium damselae]|uniref:Competence protein ComEA helix-hairpin-helix repeat region n=5 Tax=Photobacterium damselae TaxID=38293 RepID=A0A2T3I6M0_PHODM|nr:ComEA family DNA-binding protein [Photobacterium damselae]EEZ40528.1 putative DNA uptake protein [Photobacterium damselae subsp. damselae CIP 102761]EHA1081259.1 helix-hairpin-helix domain-containing protein [Photobacterium damselae]EJN6959982.1 helix-hairpin-helix domain-containing protein [Photobacterium damselae]ELI6447938.1 helix-hairpin-helix domain-containing protein [Photobacterium damselae]KAB1175264.1 helix-hairpin-helix domain-containing protein [Photobacterium damselae subsp. dam